MSVPIFDVLMIPDPFLLFLHLQIITFAMLTLTCGMSSLKQQQSNFQDILEVFFSCDALQKPWQADSVPRQILFMLTDNSYIPWLSGSLRCFLFQMGMSFLSLLSQQAPGLWSEGHNNKQCFVLGTDEELSQAGATVSFFFPLLPQHLLHLFISVS